MKKDSSTVLLKQHVFPTIKILTHTQPAHRAPHPMKLTDLVQFLPFKD